MTLCAGLLGLQMYYNSTDEQQPAAPATPAAATAPADNTATATANAKNYAYVKGTSFGSEAARSGNLEILSRVDSYAKAGFTNSAATLTGYNAGVMVMTATAKGDFKAELDSSDANIYVTDLSVQNQYLATAEAKSTQPGGGISAGLVSGTTNKATAVTSTNATGGITGSGSVDARNIAILVSGDGSKAIADVDGAKVTITAGSVGINLADASVEMNQDAYIAGSGSVTTSGTISVKSTANNTLSQSELGSN